MMFDAIWSLQTLKWLLIASVPVWIIADGLYSLFWHPLRKYPGPWYCAVSRLPIAYKNASGRYYKWADGLHKKYGPVVRTSPSDLSFTNPEAWNDIFSHRPQLAKTPFAYPPASADLPDTIMTAGDAYHARLRRSVAAGFSYKAMDEVEPIIQGRIDEMVAALRHDCSQGSQNVRQWITWTITDIIGDLALSTDFECIKERRHHPWTAAIFPNLKGIMLLNQLRRLGLSTPVGALLSTNAAKRARDKIRLFTVDHVQARLARERTEEGKQTKDLLGMIVRDPENQKDPLSDPEIAALSLTLVIAGSETTTTALAGMMYYLTKSPRVLKKLTEEIRTAFPTAADITTKNAVKLRYLNGAVEEALRLFIPAPSLPPRIVPKSGHKIGGEWIPGGTGVTIANYHNSHSDEFFDNASDFRPERWIDGGEGSHTKRHVKNAYSAFSAGPRNCVGKTLALTEMRLLTAKLLWHFDMELDGPHDGWLETARFYVSTSCLLRFPLATR
ncbi:uncharacterized protein HMPREF1541_03881 [Cyphellophora europaea CBS 101466]|uniref:Cytochrome P450 monooxygenase n=1 Tax=Cyphellophora europaea (strain CBS 101466) TaxID=1220924 RepID=W2RZU3_CYPE1|nr:uncharacterized protein HMPREF1541_03881 [Cyphellophora europaea CBS 101466]ETN41942.1 hypothetical protein HMPREF1541_03881 [Cyphellophora europaea CBS 101466]